MGKNTLGNLVKNAAIKAGLEGRLTNLSLRKSTVTALSEAGVAPHKIQQITSHKSL
jgi:site-specific recombinase XerD